MVWTDPSTGESFIVDTATGNSRRAFCTGEGNSNAPRRTILARGRNDGEKADVPSWIGEALTVCFQFEFKPFSMVSQIISQANEVYVQKEKPIPVVPCSDAFISDMRHYELQKQLQYKQGASQATNSSYRFSRDDLKEAIVVNQVDSKFIACLLPSDSATGDPGCGSGAPSQEIFRTLVLVDQHAADERVRVEWLQRDICLAYLRNDDETGVERIVLDPPVPVLLTRHEKHILQRSDDIRGFLASWGVELAPINDVGEEDSGSDDAGNYSQVTATRVPEIVSNRVCDIGSLTHPGADEGLVVFGG